MMFLFLPAALLAGIAVLRRLYVSFPSGAALVVIAYLSAAAATQPVSFQLEGFTIYIEDLLGASLIVIEHDMPLISSISDRLIALDQGAVVTIGKPNDVLEDPQVVESYLGSSGAAISRSGSESTTGG